MIDPRWLQRKEEEARLTHSAKGGRGRVELLQKSRMMDGERGGGVNEQDWRDANNIDRHRRDSVGHCPRWKIKLRYKEGI